ncbi:uncharacterized protein LY79DRAFT_586971 [Colletotrichum navitas]|uniref:Uncharacterized protein n=1 Tax=Colletotrichum navitas TaxID=681940 RepID=A0AAD8QCH1_9PEZI|nr:uncharacterized protein LY79DRAFT_586971 [Colletotrichum navitas]KAK1598409.1 hypothetical protein LY79DRAFT_586971 [Colletotrichum navitas]
MNNPINHPPSTYGGYPVMEQHPYYPQVLDFSEADSGHVDYPQTNMQSQYPPQAPDVQQSEPCQAWADVNAKLHTMPRPGNAVLLAPQPMYLTPSSIATDSQYSSPSLIFDQTHLKPYWACDTVSNTSGQTNNSSRHETCSSCGESVNSRQMQRHIQDRHRQEGDPHYVCKCGRAHPFQRKWNHIRHLDNCKRKGDPGRVFTCRCGNSLSDLLAHLDHIEHCGNRRPGRPRTIN